MKKAYEAPAIEELGSFETLTRAASSGSRLDAAFAAETPVADLTFS